jgi:hypothetical protein
MLDQAEIMALWDYCHAMGRVDYFSPTFPKLYGLLAEDRDWQPGEVRCANWYLAKVVKLECPMTGKVKGVDRLGCVRSCEWLPYCFMREALAG